MTHPRQLGLLLLASLLAAACGLGGSGGDIDGGVDNWPHREIEQRTHQLINEHRSSQGLAQLEWRTLILKEARGHSSDMASGAVAFGHDGFEQRVSRISEVIPLSAAAENVGMNQGYSDPADQAVQGWLNSPPHKTNIEGAYGLTAVGVEVNGAGATYLTQIFVRAP